MKLLVQWFRVQRLKACGYHDTGHRVTLPLLYLLPALKAIDALAMSAFNPEFTYEIS
jgi:hypothetical protein